MQPRVSASGASDITDAVTSSGFTRDPRPREELGDTSEPHFNGHLHTPVATVRSSEKLGIDIQNPVTSPLSFAGPWRAYLTRVNLGKRLCGSSSSSAGAFPPDVLWPTPGDAARANDGGIVALCPWFNSDGSVMAPGGPANDAGLLGPNIWPGEMPRGTLNAGCAINAMDVTPFLFTVGTWAKGVVRVRGPAGRRG